MVAIFHIIVKNLLEVIYTVSTENENWKAFDAARNEYYDLRKDGKFTDDKDWELTESILAFKDYLVDEINHEILMRVFDNDTPSVLAPNIRIYPLEYEQQYPFTAEDVKVEELEEWEY